MRFFSSMISDPSSHSSFWPYTACELLGDQEHGPILVLLRICIDLGLHRRARKERLNVETEMRKRRFWTCYFLDGQVSIVLGRPFAISDHHIDLPVSCWLSLSNFRSQSFNVELLPRDFPSCSVSISPSASFNTDVFLSPYTSHPSSPYPQILSDYILNLFSFPSKSTKPRIASPIFMLLRLALQHQHLQRAPPFLHSSISCD
jgi:hypothetical protein